MTGDMVGLLVLAALAGPIFIVGARRRIQFVGRGHGIPRQRGGGAWLRPVSMFARMAARPAVALAHGVVTLGLVLFAPRLATLVGRIFDPGYTWLNGIALWQNLYRPIWGWTQLALLAAVGFFLLRRWVLKPRHLDRSLAHEVSLFWLALVLTGDLLHEVAHSALLLQAEMVPPYPVSRGFGHLLLESGFYTSELVALSRFGLWTAVGGVVLGLATLPFGPNLHRLTGWLTIRHGQSIMPPDGVSRKHLLDAITCTQCGRCDAACERRHDARALRPSSVPRTLLELPATLTGSDLLAHWLTKVGAKEVARCDGCGDCDASCPLAISLLDGLVTLANASGLTCPIPHVEKLEDD
jgi:hypothetical protein